MMTLTRHGHQKLVKNDQEFKICIINPFDLIWLAGIIKLPDFLLENDYFSMKISKKYNNQYNDQLISQLSLTDDKGGSELEILENIPKISYFIKIL